MSTQMWPLVASCLLLLVVPVVHCQWPGFQWFSNDPDIFRNTTQLIESRGFSSELHYPVTMDGHILTLVRIINPFISDRSSLRPIYIQHGLFGSGDDFIISHKGRLLNGVYYETERQLPTNCSGANPDSMSQSVAYTLAACGYDVWLGNYRGNRYSNRHVVLSQSDPEYWAFSVDELALYDIPANIEYILSTTGRGELGYIGHSLGTSGMFQLLSARPQYSPLIRPYIALAPVAHVFNIKSLLLQVAAHFPPLITALGATNAPFFGMSSANLALLDQLIASTICGNSITQQLCVAFLFSLTGFDSPNTDANLVTISFGHFPDNTASRVLAHLAQRVTENSFSFYDYGPVKNQELYRSPVVPVYNLSLIDNRYMILMSSTNDYLADPTDVDQLRSRLSVRPYIDYVIPYPLFNHVDFLYANNAGKVQNSLILKWLQELYAQK